MHQINSIKIALVVIAASLISCSGDAIPSFPTQSWSGIQIEVQTRPPKLAPGMNEFIIIATRDQRQAAHNLIISLRINEGRWHQAIQDGKVGAYRRALSTPNPQQDILYVRIEYDNRQGLLRFPLNQQRVRSEESSQS